MNLLLTADKSLFSLPAAQVASGRVTAHPMITFATLNRVEVTLHTSAGKEKYRVQERDEVFLISKLQRGFFGFTYFKKLAQARNRENALKIIHILAAGDVLHWEVSPVDYFEGNAF